MWIKFNGIIQGLWTEDEDHVVNVFRLPWAFSHFLWLFKKKFLVNNLSPLDRRRWSNPQMLIGLDYELWVHNISLVFVIDRKFYERKEKNKQTNRNLYRENALSELRGLHAVLQRIWINRCMHNNAKQRYLIIIIQNNWIQHMHTRNYRTKTKTKRMFHLLLLSPAVLHRKKRMILLTTSSNVYFNYKWRFSVKWVRSFTIHQCK